MTQVKNKTSTMLE